MQLLLVVNDMEALAALAPAEQWNAGSFDFQLHTVYKQHEVTACICGHGIFQTAYKVTKTLSTKRFHLALKFSRCNAYKETHRPGDVLNIINEKPGDYGSWAENEWHDLYDLGLLRREDRPHVRSGFVNMTNSYMDIFLPYKKCVGISVNDYGNTNTFALRATHYKAECETPDGLGFAYPCLYEKQSFYHLAVVERNVATGETNSGLATQRLHQLISEITEKL